MKTVKSLLESIIDDCRVPQGNVASIKVAAEAALALLEKDRKPHITEDGKGIFIPFIERIISLNAMKELGDREMNWDKSMEWCKERGLEMLNLEDAQIAFAQIKSINEILKGNDIPEVEWAWSGTQFDTLFAWGWISGGWSSYGKSFTNRIVPIYKPNQRL